MQPGVTDRIESESNPWIGPPEGSTDKVIHWALAFVAAGLSFLFLVPFLHEALSFDESVYFTVAQSGSLPYIDVIDQKPPAIYLWYHLALLINGGHASAFLIHLEAAVALSITTFLVFLIGRSWHSARFGSISAVAFSLLMTNQYMQIGANTETFALPFACLGILAFGWGLAQERVAAWVTCGLVCAVATLTKTTFALEAFGMVCLLAFYANRLHTKRKAYVIGALLITGTAGLICFLSILPWLLSGHFDDFWYANVTFNAGYSSTVPLTTRPILLGLGSLAAMHGSLVLWLLALLGVSSGTLKNGPKMLAAVWAGTGLVGVAATGLFFAHYFVALLPCLAIYAAAGLYGLRGRWHRVRVRVLSTVVLGAFAVLTLISIVPMYLLYDTDEAHAAKFQGNGEIDPLAGRLSKLVTCLTKPEDRIYVVGGAVQVYPLTGRKPAARFITTGFLTFVPEHERETFHEFVSAKPVVVIETYIKNSALDDDPQSDQHQIREEFLDVVRREYQIIDVTETEHAVARVWLRVGSTYRSAADC